MRARGGRLSQQVIIVRSERWAMALIRQRVESGRRVSRGVQQVVQARKGCWTGRGWRWWWQGEEIMIIVVDIIVAVAIGRGVHARGCRW